MHASAKMHDDMLQQVLRAPITFFDVTPIGRILNRFSADLDWLDLNLPFTLLASSNAVALIVGSIIAIIISTKGTFLVPLAPMVVIYYFIQKWFRKSSTELQRLTNISNSPIFADFQVALSGVPVIHAYGAEERFFENMKLSFDHYNVVFVLFSHCANWLSLWLDVLGGVMQSSIGALALSTIHLNIIPASLLGLALSFSIETTTYLKQCVRTLSRLEAHMSSVERILFYSRDIPEEGPDIIPANDPQEGTWPSKGGIEIKDINLHYQNSPLVLKNISLSIQPGEKVSYCFSLKRSVFVSYYLLLCSRLESLVAQDQENHPL